VREPGVFGQGVFSTSSVNIGMIATGSGRDKRRQL
jgi:hypothetical protein